MGQHVFISCARQDMAQATAVCDVLERYGISCWMAHRNIHPGAAWPPAIADAVGAASLMLVLISTSANSSRHVAREIELADREQIPIIPLRIEDIFPSNNIEYFINNIQWIDIFPEPIETYGPILSQAIDHKLGKNFQKKENHVVSGTLREPTTNIRKIIAEFGYTEKKSWFSVNITAKAAGALTGIVLCIGVAAGVFYNMNDLSVRVCGLYTFRFCENEPNAIKDAIKKDWQKLNGAGYDVAKLESVVRDAETPEVREQAQSRLDTIKNEREKLNNAGFDKTKLKTLAEDAKTPEVRDEISERRNVVGAGYNLSILTALASDTKTQSVQEEINRRRDVIAAEEKSYVDVKNDISGLTEFVHKPCEACLVQDVARNHLDVIKKDWEGLDNAGDDETKLRILAQVVETPDVQAEIRRRLGVIALIKARIQSAEREVQEENKSLANAKFNETKLKSLNKVAKTPAVQEEIKRRLGVIMKGKTLATGGPKPTTPSASVHSPTTTGPFGVGVGVGF